MPSALRCLQIDKSFGALKALEQASLTVAPGAIHALVGENGAGKSTLMNIVSGLLKPDAGSVEVEGKPVRFGSPLDSVSAGIGMVHQHFLLAEALTAAENVALGMRKSQGGLSFNRADAEAALEKLGHETGLHVNPRACVSDLSVGERQRVEILKALSRGAKILLLDEPTAVLAPPEVKTLFDTLHKLRDAGRTIVLITHKLDEVFALASSVTVLRRGRTVFEGALQGLTARELATHMIGSEPPALTVPAEPAASPVLKIENLSVSSVHGHGLEQAAFSVKAGEILGIAGVEGNGQEELAGALAGTLQPKSGSLGQLFTDEPSRPLDFFALSPAQRAAHGLAVIPADRQKEGLVLEFSLAENYFLREAVAVDSKIPSSTGPFIRTACLEEAAREPLKSFDVYPPEPQRLAGQLSGGNQQKVIVARELQRVPRLIVAHNPTRGLDLGATAAVHRRLLDAAATHKAAVILISSDLDEILALSHTVHVLYGGRLHAVGTRGVTKEVVGRAMVGAGE